MVTGDRAPRRLGDVSASVVVLERDSIEDMPAVHLGDLVGRAGGAHLRLFSQPGLVAMTGARGFFGGGEAEYVQLRIDGVPAADVESGLADWTGVRARDIQRIEILGGPGSSLYGDTALGGVAQVFTRRSTAPEGGDVLVGFGPFGSAFADAAGRVVRGPWRWSLDGVATDDRGHRDHASRRERGFTGLMARTTSRGMLRFVAAGQEIDRLDPGVLPLDARDRSASDELFELDVEHVGRRQLSLTWEHATEGARFSAAAHYSRRHSTAIRTLLIAAGVGDRAHRALSATAWGFSGDGERRFLVFARPATLRGGLDVGADDLTSRYSAVAATGAPAALLSRSSPTRQRAALFATQDVMVGDRLRVGIGLRRDVLDDRTALSEKDHGAWSPHFSAGLRTGRDSIAFARLSRAFKAPTLDQLFDQRPLPDFEGGTFMISNAVLSPQRADALEAGFRHRGRLLAAAISLYTMRVRDEIDFDARTFRYQNIGRSRHQGVELSLDAFRDAVLAPRLSYTLTMVRSPSVPGQLKNIPRHVAQLAGRARLPLDITSDLAVTWTSRRYLDDANKMAIGPDLDVACRLRRPVGRADLRLDLLNLTDADTWGPGYVLPGLDGVPVPHALPGAPRGVRIGLAFDF